MLMLRIWVLLSLGINIMAGGVRLHNCLLRMPYADSSCCFLDETKMCRGGQTRSLRLRGWVFAHGRAAPVHVTASCNAGNWVGCTLSACS